MMNANYECEHVSGTSLLNPRKQRGMQELAFNIWFYSFMLFPPFAFITLIAYYSYRLSLSSELEGLRVHLWFPSSLYLHDTSSIIRLLEAGARLVCDGYAGLRYSRLCY